VMLRSWWFPPLAACLIGAALFLLIVKGCR
jgi:hypothetical protein